MKRFLTITILAGLLFFACNRESDNDVVGAHFALPKNVSTHSFANSYEALHDTLDSLNTLLFQKIKAADVALRESAPQRGKIHVEARTALWPLYAN